MTTAVRKTRLPSSWCLHSIGRKTRNKQISEHTIFPVIINGAEKNKSGEREGRMLRWDVGMQERPLRSSKN